MAHAEIERLRAVQTPDHRELIERLLRIADDLTCDQWTDGDIIAIRECVAALSAPCVRCAAWEAALREAKELTWTTEVYEKLERRVCEILASGHVPPTEAERRLDALEKALHERCEQAGGYRTLHVSDEKGLVVVICAGIERRAAEILAGEGDSHGPS